MKRIGPITKKLQRFEDELKIAKIGSGGVEVGQKSVILAPRLRSGLNSKLVMIDYP